MRTVGLLPSFSTIAGAACAPLFPFVEPLAWLPAVFLAAGLAGWLRRSTPFTVGCIAAGFWTCAVVLASHADDRALYPSLRTLLDREVGGFDIATLGPENEHDPIVVRALLTEDASIQDGFVALRVRAIALRVGEQWRHVDGGVTVSVGGSAALDRVLAWRAGRTIQAPMTFRRPARFLNDGVPDLEQALARDGTTLFGSVKSALIVDVISRGGPIDEIAADIRAHVRAAVATWIAPHSAVSAAIAAAVLIGDRTGVPNDTRDALQAAGTYHVIAISGGNIAIVAAGAWGVCALLGIRGRRGALVTIVALVAFATVVTSGPSVWRATLMAIAYFAARALDHRTPVWQAMAMAAAAILIIHPLDLNDPGFLLTFGATTALVQSARFVTAFLSARRLRHSLASAGSRRGRSAGEGRARAAIVRAISWIAATVVGSLAVEAALLPVSAFEFSRVTSAGLILNLLAVPAMAVVQIAATIVALVSETPWLAHGAGWTTHLAASALVSSAQLVTVAPWLAARVPPPHVFLVLVYYLALFLSIYVRGRWRIASVVLCLAALVSIVSGARLVSVVRGGDAQPSLRLTVFDVGQGESMLLEAAGRSVLIDTGGAPFGTGLDIGRRVLAPALWHRGISSLDAMLITHGDPDHLGGARTVADDFRPRAVWEGVRLPQHLPTRQLLDEAARLGVPVTPLRAGEERGSDGVRLRVLHPPPPDWERRRVRNDDSVVIEVVYGDVALLLTGDISADVERAILPLLTRSRIRVLKVAHHGSRTSSSTELLDGWRPHVAVISCGRGNRFGHPTMEVLGRLAAVGATVLRTDLDGQVTIETDGRSLHIRTYADLMKGHEGVNR